jgi:hypothetical protein
MNGFVTDEVEEVSLFVEYSAVYLISNNKGLQEFKIKSWWFNYTSSPVWLLLSFFRWRLFKRSESVSSQHNSSLIPTHLLYSLQQLRSEVLNRKGISRENGTL